MSNIRRSRTLPLIESLQRQKHSNALHRVLFEADEPSRPQKKTLRFMVAAPGSGKSSHIVKHHPDAAVVSADKHPGLYGPSDKPGGTPSFNPKKLGDAHAHAQQQAAEHMAAGHPHVIVDNTNTAAWQLAPYLKKAKEHDYQVAISHVHAPLEQIRRRGVHFPKDKPKTAKDDRLAGMKKEADGFAKKLHSLKDHPDPMKQLDKEGAFHAPWETGEKDGAPRQDHSYAHGLKMTDVQSHDTQSRGD